MVAKCEYSQWLERKYPGQVVNVNAQADLVSDVAYSNVFDNSLE